MAKVKNAIIQHMNADYAEIERRVMAEVAERWRGPRAEVEAAVRSYYSETGLFGHQLEAAVQAEMRGYDFIKAGEPTGRISETDLPMHYITPDGKGKSSSR